MKNGPQSSSVDTLQPEGPWDFDADVTEVFDDMLARSIPQYEMMRDAVYRLGTSVLKDDDWIIDLGSSRGEAVARLIERTKCRATLVEVSEPMREVLRTRFKDDDRVRVRSLDLRHSFPEHEAGLILSVLTLMFIPINYRQRVIQRAYDALRPGGAFIVVEKLLGQSADLDFKFQTFYHALKHDSGYDYESIDRKAASLEGVLVPVTAAWNIELLRQAGFRQIDCFWRWFNFGGFIAIK